MLRTVAHIVVSGTRYEVDHRGLVDWEWFREDNTQGDILACSGPCWERLMSLPLSAVFAA